MPATSSAAKVEGYIGGDFRRKFVDEENYIETVEWHEFSSSIINAVPGPRGKPYRKGEGSLDRKSVAKNRTERSEVADSWVIGLVDAAHQPPTRRINIDAMRSGSKKAWHSSRANGKALRQSVGLRLVRQPIDWTKLDQVGRPVVSFDPFSPERPKLIKLLKRDSRDITRQALVRKLGVEFSRIYERYRRDTERRLRGGVNMSGLYEVQGDKERRACEDAALLCVFRGVTPRQVLEYWDKNVKDYTGGHMTIPPLAFLKQASVIDRVAVSSSGTVAKLGRLKKREPEVKLRPADRNTFSGTDGLDVRLRTTLESAGFKTQAYNDRYLLSIQHNALAVAGGKSIFLAGKMRELVMCAVNNLYADA